MHSRQGNVGLADGSAQQFSRSALQTALQNTGDQGQVNSGPFIAPPGCSPAGLNPDPAPLSEEAGARTMWLVGMERVVDERPDANHHGLCPRLGK